MHLEGIRKMTNNHNEHLVNDQRPSTNGDYIGMDKMITGM